MRLFRCCCGNRVFFNNRACIVCGRELGFDPETLEMVSLEPGAGGQAVTSDGRIFRRCQNADRYDNCNWLLQPGDTQDLCFSCRMNEVIPALDRTGNLKLWTRIEEAKRRLLYSLLSLGMPLSGSSAPKFRFMEDHRRNPDVFEEFVATGHFNQTITVNIAEADDVARHAAREQMHELYRTVLGHLRHEVGHLYFGLLFDSPDLLNDCRALFGDERLDYHSALNAYYQNGPRPDWPAHFVSAYASAHPAEDFAETFAHFLHIKDALESARAGFLAPGAVGDSDDDWIEAWIALSITLNEISRSLGSDDPYPFVLSEPVKLKLEFIDRLVRRQAAPTAG